MPPLEVEFSPRFRANARALPPDRQEQIGQAVALVGEAFGKPHLHTGLGIRRLKGAYFEFRVGRDLRVVFKLNGSVVTLLLVGTHDAVQRFLKNL